MNSYIYTYIYIYIHMHIHIHVLYCDILLTRQRPYHTWLREGLEEAWSDTIILCSEKDKWGQH